MEGVVLHGLAQLFGSTDRKVWVFDNGKGSTKFRALRPEQEPPEVEPNYPDHRLVGLLDLETGDVGPGQEMKWFRVFDLVWTVLRFWLKCLIWTARICWILAAILVVVVLRVIGHSGKMGAGRSKGRRH